MPFIENRQDSSTEQHENTRPLPMPGLLRRYAPAEPSPFPDDPLTPPDGMPIVQTGDLPNMGVSQELMDLGAGPRVTRQLTAVRTATLMTMNKNTTTSLRHPVVIPGAGKKEREAPPKTSIRRRLIIQLTVTAFLAFVVLSALMAVLPANTRGQSGFDIFPTIFKSVGLQGNNTGLLAQQAATATAVTQDGYDPGANTGQYGGVPAAPPSSSAGGLGRFFYGQCTYWANMRYHQLTGVWVPWLGNANQWTAGAYSSGWVVSGAPHVPSIVVLQSYVQGAGYYGHVAVVESINKDGSAHTSNWNWYGNGGGWARLSYVDFFPGKGVSFVYAPGK